MFKIVKKDNDLLLVENLMEIDEFSGLLLDYKNLFGKDQLTQGELLDLIYEAENQSLLKFGALTGQPPENIEENKKVIEEYFENLE